MTKIRTIRTVAISVCFLQLAILQLVLPRVLMACPTCKDGLHDDGTAAAYAISILFMMGMPFVILTCWVTTIMRLRSRMSDVARTDLDY
jgi:hypothetical protein